ncbi:hypothetical protein P7C71_g5709, partial [Lecanoromycetidae sp. Uapishka_2]
MAEDNPELQEKLRELDFELEEGEITQKGYQKRRTLILSQYLAPPGESARGLRVHSPDDTAHPSNNGSRAASFAALTQRSTSPRPEMMQGRQLGIRNPSPNPSSFGQDSYNNSGRPSQDGRDSTMMESQYAFNPGNDGQYSEQQDGQYTNGGQTRQSTMLDQAQFSDFAGEQHEAQRDSYGGGPQRYSTQETFSPTANTAPPMLKNSDLPPLGALGHQLPLEPREVPFAVYDPHNGNIPMSKFDNIATVLRHRARTNPKQPAYWVLDQKGKEISSITWEKLASRAEKVAQVIRDKSNLYRGDRVALIYRDIEIIDFAVAFMGCFIAGVVAVPINDFDVSGGNLADYHRLNVILTTTQAHLALTTDVNLKNFQRDITASKLNWPRGVEWWKTNEFGSFHPKKGNEAPPLIVPDLAYIEFSRAPTGDLRGVVMSHRTIMHQMACLSAIIQTIPTNGNDTFNGNLRDKQGQLMTRSGAGEVLLSYLDPRQSIGLILSLLLTVYGGHTTVWMQAEAGNPTPMAVEPEFLRTGLLGCIIEGKVFVLGLYEDRLRQKVEWVEHGMHDAEYRYFFVQHLVFTIMRNVPKIFDCTAFDVFSNDEHLPIVLLESAAASTAPTTSGGPPRQLDTALLDSLSERCMEILYQEHHVRVYCVMITAPKTLPRVVKNGRREIGNMLCRKEFDLGSLPCVHVKFGVERAVLNLPVGVDPVGGIWSQISTAARQEILQHQDKQYSGVDYREVVIDDRTSTPLNNFSSIVDLLQWRVARQSEELAYCTIDGRGREGKGVNWKKFDMKVAAVAQYLQNKAKVRPGDHLILMYTHSEEFIYAVHACFCLGAVAIPMAPLDQNRLNEDAPAFLHMVADFRVKAVLVNADVHHLLGQKIVSQHIKQSAQVLKVAMPPTYNTGKPPKQSSGCRDLGFTMKPDWIQPSRPVLIWTYWTPDQRRIAVQLGHDTIMGTCKVQKETCQMTSSRPVLGCVRSTMGLGFVHTCLMGVFVETNRLCHIGEYGEIWVQSEACVKSFYGSRDAFDAERFNGRTVDGDPHVTYVRTGDLGFLHNVIRPIGPGGQPVEMQVLFVLGGIGETFEVNGLSHFPMDIESSIEKCHRNIVNNGCAVFQAGGLVVVLVEVMRKAYLASIVPVIVNAVLNEHQVVVDIVAFVTKGDFPRSRLGEKQRGKILASWVTRKMRTIAQFGIRDADGADSQITEVAEPRSGLGSVVGAGSSLKNVETVTSPPANQSYDQAQDYTSLPTGVSEMPTYESSITESPPRPPPEEDRDETPTEPHHRIDNHLFVSNISDHDQDQPEPLYHHQPDSAYTTYGQNKDLPVPPQDSASTSPDEYPNYEAYTTNDPLPTPSEPLR